MTEDNTTTLPNDYLAELVDYLLGHGKTHAANELADRMAGEWNDNA